MKALTRTEILHQLNRLGIKGQFELDKYFMDYMKYIYSQIAQDSVN